MEIYYDLDDHSSEDDERQPSDSIFKLNGQPIPMHLHRSLSRGGAEAMSKKIEDAGGFPHATEEEARVIICRCGTPIFTELEYVYDHDRYKWVEPPSWVDTCIQSGRYKHILPSREMNKPRSGTRTPFTREDDENLVTFLAHRIPYKESGGRMGNGVYKDLCSDARAGRYPWAKRHSWQSWRHRYAENQDIFDPRINYEVRRDRSPPKPGGKGQYVIPRKMRRPVALRYNVEADSDPFEERETGQRLRQAERQPQRQPRRKQQQRQEEEEEEEEEDGVVNASPTNPKIPSRQEPDLWNDHYQGRQQSGLPPRKKPRMSSNYEDEASVGIGRDKGKTKGRQVPSESFGRFETVDLDDAPYMNFHDDYEPGPSQPYHKRFPDIGATVTSSEVIVAMTSSPLHKAGDIRAAEPSSTAPQMPPDTQMTLVAPTQRLQDPNSTPHSAQATIASSSPFRSAKLERTRQGRRGVSQEALRKISRQPVSRKSVPYNTRSRRPPEEELVQLNMSPPLGTEKKPRGRPPKSHASALVRPQKEHQRTPTSAANASIREEVQVEEILQVSEKADVQEPEDGDRGSSEALSSEEDAAAKTLREANKQLMKDRTRDCSKPRGTTAADASAPDQHDEVPFIDMSRETPSNSRKPTLLSPSSVNIHHPDLDPDPTPKAIPSTVRRAAKKTAAREPSSDLPESESEMASETTETTDSSFPIVTTNARGYLNSQGPYTPAPGTKAEQHIRSNQGKSRAGSRRLH